MLRIGKGIWVALTLALLIGLPFAGSTLSAPGSASSDPRIARFGIGVTEEWGYTITDYNLDLLRIRNVFPFGWYSNWWMNVNPPRPHGMEYAQLIWVRRGYYPPDARQWERVIRNNPGSLWIIGNEPECPYQANITPTRYAEIYHDAYWFIKRRDPTAKVAIGGVVQPSRLRLKWLDQVLIKYQELYTNTMPVDVWNIHNQILNEELGGWGAGIPAGLTETVGITITIPENASLDLFKKHVRDLRVWMKNHGLRDKPAIISEYGVLLPSEMLVQDNKPAGDQLVIDFMQGTFDFLLNATDPEIGCPSDDYRLIQRWLWYSLNEPPYDPGTGRGFNGSLFVHNQPNTLTIFGGAFRAYARSLYRLKVNLPLVLKLFPSVNSEPRR